MYIMAEVTVFKTNEKVLLWLHRENKTQVWLAEQLGVKRAAVSNKITFNGFTGRDIEILRKFGYDL